MWKILRKFAVVLAFIGAIFMTACYTPPECETYNQGDVTFHDNGPSWVWNGCYIEVDWSNGSYNTGTFYDTKNYYDKSAGRADVYMEWEDDDAYYWTYGYITVIQCGHVDAYCTWDSKKSAVISDFTTERNGKVQKSEIDSIEEFRESIIGVR